MQNISAKDFYKPCKYNFETKNQMWMSNIADSHDSWCDCDTPFAHLLASIFPVGHRDRLLSIQQILERDYRERCLSGGADAKDSGMAASEGVKETDGIKQEDKEDEDSIPEADVEDLLNAVADAEKR